jgi:hypothetical protein
MKNAYNLSRLHIFFLVVSILLVWVGGAQAQGLSHDRPFDFLFDNHIDTHQQTKLRVKGGKPVSLFGFFYIFFTGEIDKASGLPVAQHPDGSPGEVCGVDIDCVVGWTMRGKPGKAKFLYHSGVNGNDHPVWMVNRTKIPQPGSWTHFHWIGQLSSDPRKKYVSDACDKENASDLETESPSAVNEICPGWFLQIRAVRSFAFEHGGEIIPIRPGIDNKSHLNLVTNYAEVPGITNTR